MDRARAEIWAIGAEALSSAPRRLLPAPHRLLHALHAWAYHNPHQTMNSFCPGSRQCQVQTEANWGSREAAVAEETIGE